MRFTLLVLLTWFAQGIAAQSVHYNRHTDQAYQAQKLFSLSENGGTAHTAIGNVWRSDVAAISDTLVTDYLKIDNPEHYPTAKRQNMGIFKLYPYRSTLLAVEQPSFSLYINPILHISGGNASNQASTPFRNTRGIDIRGSVDHKVYFHTNILETQANFLDYQNRRFNSIKAIDGQGFYKPYDSKVSSLQGYDFLNAVGYVGVPISKHINLELGHGSHFIGHGYHSLLLNDYANNYLYLSLDTRVWKLHYKNVFAEVAALSSNVTGDNTLLPKKYFAAHYLSIKPTKWLECGLFETVVFSREDHFEFQYLNPIILYRTVEQLIDSPDNVMIGLNGKITLGKTNLYGQFLLDELKINEITSDEGWWGNKYGIQLGVMSYDVFGLGGLDIRLEYNQVRPFTYSHLWSLEKDPTLSTGSYSHFSQPLAHPLGSNFREVVGVAKYQLGNKWLLEGKLLIAQKGDNPDGENVGGDILVRNGTRAGNYGYELLGGIRRDIVHGAINLDYVLYHNVKLRGTAIVHQDSRQGDYTYFGFGVLVNSFDYPIDY